MRRRGRRAVPGSAAASAVALSVAIGLGGKTLWSAPGSVRQSAPGPNAIVVFGPQRFDIVKGKAIHIERFTVEQTEGQRFTLVVENGSGSRRSRVKRGTVRLNGLEVVNREEGQGPVEIV